jgi:hypothetical protein
MLSSLNFGIDVMDNLGIASLLRTKSFIFQVELNPEKFQKARSKDICTLIILVHTSLIGHNNWQNSKFYAKWTEGNVNNCKHGFSHVFWTTWSHEPWSSKTGDNNSSKLWHWRYHNSHMFKHWIHGRQLVE